MNFHVLLLKIEITKYMPSKGIIRTFSINNEDSAVSLTATCRCRARPIFYKYEYVYLYFTNIYTFSTNI